jgi:putative membrane protein
MWIHMNDYGWGWAGMGLGMLLFWVLLIAAIVLLFRSSSGPGGGRSHERSALDLLKERYARGEIEREEFLQKKHDLED